MRGWAFRVLAFALCVLGLSPVVLAAPADVDVLEARFGFCDGLVPERWTPLFLKIASEKDGFSGMLEVTHAQDSSQRARVVLPVATTPGATTSVAVVLCVPEETTLLTLDFTDELSGRRRSIEYRIGGSTDGRSDVRDLPPLDSVGRRVVTVEAPRSLTDALKVRDMFAGIKVPQEGDTLWGTVWHGAVEPDNLPLAWAAYDSADVVVVNGDLGLRGDNRVDPRALDALMAWVRSGGRLVVLVEPLGDGWQRFVDHAAGVIVQEQSQIAVPRRAALPVESTPTQDAASKKSDEAPKRLELAAAIRARPIHLSDAAVRGGWLLDYGDASMLEPGQTDPWGVVASGPVGFGMVTLITFDPARVPKVSDLAASTLIWHDLLHPMLMREQDRSNKGQSSGWYRRMNSSSGSSVQEQSAISGVLDEMTNVPSLGHGLFLTIAAVVLMLAMLVGPVDAIVLKKRGLRQYSWLTSLGWIGIASVASAIAPSLIRSGANRFFRVATYDALVGSKGNVVGACREGITSILPGQGRRIVVRDTADGAMHRGVSSVAGQVREGLASATLPLFQGTPAKGTLRGVMPMESPVRQWSVRATMDEAPVSMPPALSDANVTAEWDGSWHVQISGLPAGVTVRSMGIEAIDGWWTLEPGPEEGRWASTAPASQWPASGAWTRMVDLPHDIEDDDTREAASRDLGISSPATALSLPLTGTRRDAIARYVQSGSWACVHVQVTGWPEDAGVDANERKHWTVQSQAVLRLLIPIERRTKTHIEAPIVLPPADPATPPPEGTSTP